MIKHQVTCSECGNVFFLEDAEWCDHYKNLGTGTKECPACRECICHGETVAEIRERFKRNRESGKFVKAEPNPFGWDYWCKTVKKIEVPMTKDISCNSNRFPVGRGIARGDNFHDLHILSVRTESITL